MSQTLYEQLSEAVLQTNLPNHNDCFHKTFLEFLECKYSSIYELKVIVEFMIQEGKNESYS